MKLFASLLIAVGCLLAVPAGAGAVVYTVDSTLDEADVTPGVGGCFTAGLKCTLRAAIQESNFSTGVEDTINFTVAFNGELADTITLGTSLPAITDPVKIEGYKAGSAGVQCDTAAGVKGPCVGVSGPAAGNALTVENANGVEIEGLAITGAAGAGAAAISVINSSEGFEARDDWLGVKLDGTAGGNTRGIFLDPDSNGATIGGTAADDRNVFANNAAEGLDIEGADNADVQGNYLGVKPDGVTQAANGKNIEITDTVAFAATGNEVGGTISGAAAPCDGACNVISGGTFAGVDLQGNGGNEEPATGPTTIHGNYFGLSAAGTTVVANGTYGVFSAEAEDVTIGGAANGDANFFAGGGTGIYHQNGEGFKALGNIIGSGPTGADVTPPGMGMFIFCLENANPVLVNGNVIEMEGGIGIEARFGGAEIRNSFIEGAEIGILTKVAPGPAGANLIEDNVIGESTVNGIRIEDNANLVFGNSVYGSGAAGIRIQNPVALVNATENQIGGNTAESENNIRESGGDAIEIDNSGGEGASQNEVARNKGDENTGLFIDLIGATTNGGIQPPAFATSTQLGASGSAEAGATVRVFRKETAEAGELESFLAEVVADGSGNWKVTYPSIPAGTVVAATQTSEAGGTSELVMATTTADPSGGNGGGGGTGGGGNTGGKGTAKDKAPPQTTIRKAPKKGAKAGTVKFKFVSSEPGSTFQCKLDKRPFKPCKSPKTYKGLKAGKHVFKVWAIDKAGNVNPTPAKKKFKLVE